MYIIYKSLFVHVTGRVWFSFLVGHSSFKSIHGRRRLDEYFKRSRTNGLGWPSRKMRVKSKVILKQEFGIDNNWLAVDTLQNLLKVLHILMQREENRRV